MTATALADQSGVGRTQLSRIENGWIIPSSEVLEALSNAMALDPDGHQTILRQADLLAERRDPVEDGVYTSQGPLHTLEAGSSQVQAHCTHILPALLQTLEYAEAVVSTVAETFRSSSTDSAYNVEREVLIRMRRQAELHREGRRSEFLINETAITDFRNPHVDMAFQVQWLMKLAERTNVSIRIIPTSAMTLFDGHAYSLLDGDAAIYDTTAGWCKTTTPVDVERYLNHWTVSDAASLDEKASMQFLQEIYEWWNAGGRRESRWPADDRVALFGGTTLYGR